MGYNVDAEMKIMKASLMTAVCVSASVYEMTINGVVA